VTRISTPEENRDGRFSRAARKSPCYCPFAVTRRQRILPWALAEVTHDAEHKAEVCVTRHKALRKGHNQPGESRGRRVGADVLDGNNEDAAHEVNGVDAPERK
jgi:hypothetical protein